MELWVEKYRPKKLSEILGQEEAISKVISLIKGFELGKVLKKKAIILHGSPGTGKTTIAHATAYDFNCEIFELNASDLRNKTKLKEILKPAMEQKSLIKKRKIILIDEADGMTGTDRGGINEVLSLIENTEFPIILTANDVWSKKLSPLRKICELVELKSLDYMTIKNVLINILRKEKKFIDQKIITNLSVKTKGDLRAAINDLQAISEIKNSSEISSILFDERNKEKSIFDALKKVFKLNPTTEILNVFDSVDMPLDEIILWMEKNIPYEYRGEELQKAFNLLSKTDIFKGRIYRKQYWRFLIYENIFLSYGISSLKKQNKSNFTKYQKPTRILKIWMNNQKTAKKKSISEKYAKYCHISIKKAMQEFPLIKMVINSKVNIFKELELDEKEIEYLKT